MECLTVAFKVSFDMSQHPLLPVLIRVVEVPLVTVADDTLVSTPRNSVPVRFVVYVRQLTID